MNNSFISISGGFVFVKVWAEKERKAEQAEGRTSGGCAALCLFCFTLFYPYLAFGSLLLLRRQRVQMLTLRMTPSISRRRRCTFSTQRRRVRFCEKLE